MSFSSFKNTPENPKIKMTRIKRLIYENLIFKHFLKKTVMVWTLKAPKEIILTLYGSELIKR